MAIYPQDLLDTLKYENGLTLVVVRDQIIREVLMCAYMNREALEKTVKTGIAHFWSLSRKQLCRIVPGTNVIVDGELSSQIKNDEFGIAEVIFLKMCIGT